MGEGAGHGHDARRVDREDESIFTFIRTLNLTTLFTLAQFA